MASRTPTVEPDMGAIDVLSTGISTILEDFRISGLQLLGSFVSMIPILGPILQIVIGGIATQFADETLGNPAPEKSLGIRFVYVVVATIILLPILFIGFLLLVLPGLFLALKFSLVIPAIWIGDKGPLEALSESWSRTSGHLLTIFGVGFTFFLIALIVLVPAFVLFVPLSSPEAIQQFNQQPLIVASPPLFAVSTLYSMTVGAVGVAAGAIMYRSFAPAPMVDDDSFESDEFGTETDF